LDTDGIQAVQIVAIREGYVQEHNIDIPARQPVQTGQQGFGPMDLKFGLTGIRKHVLHKLGIAGVVFDE
jgi:hypothetical protein